MLTETSNLPLEGVRVLDLSRVLAGPFCGMLLADLGADVVKVERPGSGDDTRGWGPPYHSDGLSAYFSSVNRNKRAVAIDLSAPAGRELLKSLIKASDVVIENFKRGQLESWGFDDDWFAQHAPRVVRGGIRGYGHRGPSSDRPGYDFVLQAESGLMAITGEKDAGATKHGVAIVDLFTGCMAAIGVLAALRRQATSGVGEKVDVNLHDTGIFMLANVAGNVLASDKDATRFGNGHPNIVPYRTFATLDDTIALAVGNDMQFERFARLLGHPEWAESDMYRTNSARVTNREQLEPLIEQVLVRHGSDYWVSRFLEAGVPVGKVRSVAEAIRSQDSLAQGLVAQVENGRGMISTLLRGPIELAGEPLSIDRPAPQLGEHTNEVLMELAGMSADDVNELLATGVVT